MSLTMHQIYIGLMSYLIVTAFVDRGPWCVRYLALNGNLLPSIMMQVPVRFGRSAVRVFYSLSLHLACSTNTSRTSFSLHISENKARLAHLILGNKVVPRIPDRQWTGRPILKRRS